MPPGSGGLEFIRSRLGRGELQRRERVECSEQVFGEAWRWHVWKRIRFCELTRDSRLMAPELCVTLTL